MECKRAENKKQLKREGKAMKMHKKK